MKCEMDRLRPCCDEFDAAGLTIFDSDSLRPRRASQRPSANASEISPHDFASYVHFLGLS